MPPATEAGDRPAVFAFPRRIIALDLSSWVGVAIGTEGAALPERTETIALSREGGEGARYCSFENEIAALFARYEPAHVILEATLPLAAMNNVAAARQAFGLRAFAYSEAYRVSASISEIDVHTVRAEVMGRRRLPREIAKREVFLFCRKRGLKVMSHHAADAALIFMWHAQRMRGEGPIAGPLFLEEVG